jgi:hypothetical protein
MSSRPEQARRLRRGREVEGSRSHSRAISPLRAAQVRRAAVGVTLKIVLAALAVAAAVAFAFAPPAAAQARKSYNFLDLAWGADMATARTKLEKAGFKVARNPVEGQHEEFVVVGLHASIASVDRGRRLIAAGKIAGQPVQVDLAFDKEERLNHVIVTSKYWDGTIPGAKAIVDLATRIVMLYEERYGPAIKRKEDGWVDTALWPRAADGSLLAVYVRGTEGFMFSPSYKTALRVDFVGGKIAETSKIEMPPESEKEPPKPRPLTKEELRKEYQKDPSEFMPPPRRP